MERINKTKWCIPVTNTLDKAVEQAVARDSHISKSEFVRDAVRKQLEIMGYNPQVFEQNRKASVTPDQRDTPALADPTFKGGKAVNE